MTIIGNARPCPGCGHRPQPVHVNVLGDRHTRYVLECPNGCMETRGCDTFDEACAQWNGTGERR